jgi:hypothetical protein
MRTYQEQSQTGARMHLLRERWTACHPALEDFTQPIASEPLGRRLNIKFEGGN